MSGATKEITVRMQHPGTCSGMFWRGDPATGASAPSNDNWPKNGALLRGTGPHRVNGEDHFKVSAIQQAGTSGFKPVPEGTWMLYDQGGLLLHSTRAVRCKIAKEVYNAFVPWGRLYVTLICAQRAIAKNARREGPSFSRSGGKQRAPG